MLVISRDGSWTLLKQIATDFATRYSSDSGNVAPSLSRGSGSDISIRRRGRSEM